jgi:hypothetical protein
MKWFGCGGVAAWRRDGVVPVAVGGVADEDAVGLELFDLFGGEGPSPGVLFRPNVFGVGQRHPHAAGEFAQLQGRSRLPQAGRWRATQLTTPIRAQADGLLGGYRSFKRLWSWALVAAGRRPLAWVTTSKTATGAVAN